MARILLIEDDAEFAEAASAMLRAGGHDIRWAASGKAAAAALREDDGFQAVLTDILMPDMDGLECIQFLKREQPHLPIIAMTGKRDTPYLRTAAHFGASLTLYKPFTMQEMHEALAKVLG